MQRRHLNDTIVAKLPFAASAEERYEINDASIENLVLRIGSRSKTFTLLTRFGGSPNPSRRPIGRFPLVSTAHARAMADHWNEQVRLGVDPAIEEAKRREKEILRRRSTFASVMEDYIAYLPTRERNRSSDATEASIRREFLNPERAPLDVQADIGRHRQRCELDDHCNEKQGGEETGSGMPQDFEDVLRLGDASAQAGSHRA
ncbi:Arm DNA-binding domain-containing protein [Ensifer adhaerens]